MTGLSAARVELYWLPLGAGGAIPDITGAVDSPRNLDTDAGRAGRLLDLVPAFPTVTWGRDELRAGEMWNSNSLIAWLLARSGHQVGTIAAPARGRAPGWSAGLTVAARGSPAPLSGHHGVFLDKEP